jgi:hypothetical protein
MQRPRDDSVNYLQILTSGLIFSPLRERKILRRNSLPMGANRKRFIYFIIALTVCRMIYINFVPIVPQEAYYWKYAKSLALSYFDHPPMSAWIIAIFTKIGGDSPFFIRIGSVLFSLATMILLFRITEKLFCKSEYGLLVTVCMAGTILFSIGATIMTPDVPFIFFWTLIIYSLVKLMMTNAPRWWYAAGTGLGLALLSKYSAVLIVPGILLYLLFSRQQRKWLFIWHPYVALILTLLIFSPVIIWNKQHEWASFLFQSSRRFNEMHSLRLNYFFQLIGSQMGMLTPYLFFLIFTGWVQMARLGFKRQNADYQFLFWLAAPVIIIFTLSSFRSLVKMNWLAPAYITMSIGSIVWMHTEESRLAVRMKKWFKPGLILGFLLVILTHLLPLFPIVPVKKGDTWTGWQELADHAVGLKNEMGGEPFIFGHEYKIPSEITYYTRPHESTCSGEILGLEGLQYDYWTQPEELLHRDAIFVYSDADKFKKTGLLEKHFKRIERLPELTITHHGRIFRIFYFIKCYDYQGQSV